MNDKTRSEALNTLGNLGLTDLELSLIVALIKAMVPVLRIYTNGLVRGVRSKYE